VRRVAGASIHPRRASSAPGKYHFVMIIFILRVHATPQTLHLKGKTCLT
jgi:hypothetical protein